MTSPARILIVEDDAAACWAIEQALAQAGYAAVVASDAAIARRRLAREAFDLVITDIRMPGESGLDLLAWIKQAHAAIPVVVTTGHGTMETAVESLRRGAFDYLPKPLDLDRTLATVARALGERGLAAAARQGQAAGTASLVGSGPAMQEVYRRIAAAAATETAVLVTGESGSGKELVARSLHRFSRRAEGPFIAVNCGALPEGLVESELFGHEPGAFTDAKLRKIGRVEAANGGTLFLDEVGELPTLAQAKLLRFLEDQRFLRVGGEQELAVDVRVIAATNRDLARMVEARAFREDLAWRLRVLSIHLPALRERMEDLDELVRHLLGRIARRIGRDIALTDAALARLRAHQWPGNVRELRNIIEEAAVLAGGGIIDAEHLALGDGGAEAPAGEEQRLLARLAGRWIDAGAGLGHQRMLDAAEEALLRAALGRTGGNQLRAAELIGINRATLRKRAEQLGVLKSASAEDP